MARLQGTGRRAVNSLFERATQFYSRVRCIETGPAVKEVGLHGQLYRGGVNVGLNDFLFPSRDEVVQSLKVGKIAEDFTRQVLERSGFCCKENNTKDLIGWDLETVICNKRILLEIKFDLMASKTGNIAIEYHNSRQNKASGIAATKSQIWCVVLQDPLSLYITSTMMLRAYVEAVKPLRRVSSGGDGNADMLLFPKEEIFPAIFQRVDNLKKIQIATILARLINV